MTAALFKSFCTWTKKICFQVTIILHSNVIEQSLVERLIFRSQRSAPGFSYCFSEYNISWCKLLDHYGMTASVKVLHLPFSKLEISAPNTFVDLEPRIDAEQNFSFSGIFSFSAQPRASQRATMHTLFWMCLTFYFISLSSFFLPESDQQQPHKLIPSNGNVPRQAGKPGQGIRESSAVQFSFMVTQKAPCFRNNPFSSFTSSSFLSARYSDKGNLYSLRPN